MNWGLIATILLIVLIILVIVQNWGKSIATATRRTFGGDDIYETNLRLKNILFEKTPYAVISTDVDGKILLWNESATMQFGWTQAEVLGKSITIIMPVEYREMHLKGVERYKKTGQSNLIDNADGAKLVGLHKDGSTFPIHLLLKSNNDNGFKTIGGFVRNISKEFNENKKCLEELEFVKIMKNIADIGGWCLSLNTGKVKVDDNFCRLFNVDENKEYTGAELSALVYPKDQLKLAEALVEAQGNKKPYTIRYRRLQANGTLQWIEAMASPVLDENGKVKEIRGIIKHVGSADEKLDEDGRI